MSALLSSYNLGNEKLQRLYVALTGDEIQKERFWAAFKEHAKRRGGIVHRGKRADQAEAAASISAATDLVGHLQAVLQTLATP